MQEGTTLGLLIVSVLAHLGASIKWYFDRRDSQSKLQQAVTAGEATIAQLKQENEDKDELIEELKRDHVAALAEKNIQLRMERERVNHLEGILYGGSGR